MLSSLMSSTGGDGGCGGGGDKAGDHQHGSNLQHCDTVFSSFPTRQLLILCADLVHRGDLPAASRAISSLLSAANTGSDDSTDRLVRQFCRALSFRIAGSPGCCHPSSSAYFLFNKITPFLRFAHLTANQAILEAAAGCRRLHILDLDTHHGLQWPLLLQTISTAGNHPPPSIRITGAGSDYETLCLTGHRLSAFARSFDLDLDFRPLLLPEHRPNYDHIIHQLDHGETLLVNCVLFLHKLQNEELLTFLRTLKALNPAVVTVAEKEMPPLPSHSSPDFTQQFAATVEYYSAIFESLEATLPPSSRERSEVEQSWLGREIQGAISGGDQSLRWSERWEFAMRSAGFKSIPPSRFAVSQGRMLLRLHYPTEGYNVEVEKEEFFFLRWKNKPLYSVSSWK